VSHMTQMAYFLLHEPLTRFREHIFISRVFDCDVLYYGAAYEPDSEGVFSLCRSLDCKI
jgi:hypothetical protein